MADNIALQLLSGVDEETQVSLGVYLWVGGSKARLFEHVCDSPEELWQTALALAHDREKCLRERFGFDGPERMAAKREVIGLDELSLDDLFP